MRPSTGDTQAEAIDVLVGPPSRPLNLADAASDPFFSTTPAEPVYGRQLSDAAKKALLERCSVLHVQKDVVRDMQDKSLAFSLRRRLMTWADESKPGTAEPRRSRVKRRRLQSSVSPTEEHDDEHDDSMADGQAAAEVRREMTTMQALEAGVPDCFKYQANAEMADAYFERNSRQRDSVIDKPVLSRLLKTSLDGQIGEEDEQERESSTTPMLLSISVYACTVTAPKAKQRYDRIVRSTQAQTSMQTDSGSENESAGSDTNTVGGDSDDTDEQLYRSQHNTRKPGRKRKYARRDGLYGELQLVQKIECRSDASLLDVRRSFVCRMDDHPEAVDSEAQFQAWAKLAARKGAAAKEAPILQRYTGRKRVTDSCMLIEGILYGEQSQEQSYARLLASYFADSEDDVVVSGKTMAETRLQALELRVGKLYWMLHQGSCEHLWAITSARSLRAEEADRQRPDALHTSASSVSTTFLLQSFHYRPLVRYMHPDRASGAYTLEKCSTCQARQASMTIVGGARFRPPRQMASTAATTAAAAAAMADPSLSAASPCVKLRGLPEESLGVCEVCWCALIGRAPPGIAELTARAGTGTVSDVSSLSFAGAGGPGWTVIPALE